MSIEIQLLEDDNWREKSGLVLRAKKQISNNVLERIWKPACVRAFLTHKAKHKDKAGKLKDELEKYGISCFVAHTDIEPTKEWIQEIENALFSMDLLIALMTENFHDSNWTDQEIGVAVGRRIPIIPIKIGKDPYGFIGKYQALSGVWTDIPKMAKDIFSIIVKQAKTKGKTKRVAINAFKNSFSYENTKFLVSNILPHLKKLEESYIDEIITAFNENGQIYDSWYAQYHLPDLLHKWTGSQYSIEDKKLIKASLRTRHNVDTDDIPF